MYEMRSASGRRRNRDQVMFTPEEKQFYEDLEWMRAKVRSAYRKPKDIVELSERFYRMQKTFHEQGFRTNISFE